MRASYELGLSGRETSNLVKVSHLVAFQRGELLLHGDIFGAAMQSGVAVAHIGTLSVVGAECILA
jgi:hypothetical protein